MTQVAFIGLGRMGHGMAGRYLDAGFAVAVWNRSKAEGGGSDRARRALGFFAGGCGRWRRCDRDHGRRRRGFARRMARQGWRGFAAKAGTLAIECSTVSLRSRAGSGARASRARSRLYRLSGDRAAGCRGRGKIDAAGRRASRPTLTGAAISRTAFQHDPAFRRGRHWHRLQAHQQSDGRDPDRRHRGGPCDRRTGRPRHEAGAGSRGDRRCRQSTGDPSFPAHGRAGFSGATFTAALRHKDAAYAVKLAESLLSGAPLMGRAAVEAYSRAKAYAPDDDEGKMIEIVSRSRGAT